MLGDRGGEAPERERAALWPGELGEAPFELAVPPHKSVPRARGRRHEAVTDRDGKHLTVRSERPRSVKAHPYQCESGDPKWGLRCSVRPGLAAATLRGPAFAGMAAADEIGIQGGV